jgi:hypothetical protein
VHQQRQCSLRASNSTHWHRCGRSSLQTKPSEQLQDKSISMLLIVRPELLLSTRNLVEQCCGDAVASTQQCVQRNMCAHVRCMLHGGQCMLFWQFC